MADITYEEQTYAAQWYQLAAIGGATGAVITFCLFSYSMSHYFRIFCRSKQYAMTQSQRFPNRTVYRLSISYFFTAWISCSVFTILRSSILTGSSADWSYTRCHMGYLSVFLFALNRLLFYMMMIKRIKVSFKGSDREYSPMLFLYIYWMLSMLCTLNLVVWVSFFNEGVYNVISTEDQSFSFCQHVGSEEWMAKGARITLRTFELMIEFYLLYLFWTGFLTLSRVLTKERLAYNQQLEQKQNAKLDVSKEIRELVLLSATVKKQSILLFGGICSTLIYYIFEAVSFEGTTLLCYDVLLNALCVWLMFTATTRYWKCCAKYGCCCCCYISQNLQNSLSKQIYTPRTRESKYSWTFPQ